MRTFPEIPILTAAVATGYGTPMLVENFDHIALDLVGSNTAAGTIKVQASNQPTKPDFTAAASPTNRWAYIQVKMLIDNSALDGGTGVVFAADGVKQAEVNCSGMRWINLQVSAYTTGTFNAYGRGFSQDED